MKGKIHGRNESKIQESKLKIITCVASNICINKIVIIPTMNELTKACECVPRSGMPNNLPAATLLVDNIK